MAKRKRYSRAGGKMLKIKRARKRAGAKPAPRLVYRDEGGKFAKRSARKKQGIQILGESGYEKPRRRTKDEAYAAASRLGTEKRAYSSTTTSGTMADRLLEAADASGTPLAMAFAKGKQSGIVIVQAGDLSHTYSFSREDLQQVIAGTLSAYFQRAHAVRERVSAKARTKSARGQGSHGKYALHRNVRVVVKLK